MKKRLVTLLLTGALSLAITPVASYADTLEDDTTAPTITNIEFDNTVVNAGETNRVYLTATDDLSGVLAVSFALRSPSGQQQIVPFDIYQDEQGRYYGDVTFSAYAEGGTWKVVQAIVIDNNYNEREYLYGQNSAYGCNVVSTNPDTTMPTLTNVELSTTTVQQNDTEPFYIYINAADNLSGVKSVEFVTNDPSGNPIQWSGSLQQDNSGRYFGTVFVPQDGPLGTYTISSITIQDNALNKREYHYSTDYSANFTVVE